MKKSVLSKFVLPFIFLIVYGCKTETKTGTAIPNENTVHYASGFSIQNYDGYSVVTVKNPWPKATKTYTYVLKEKDGKVPDSLGHNLIIPVPIKTIVVTSTTHIPSLEMLGEVNSLIGFPHSDYISSEKVRTRIDAGKVKELGNNQDLNTEAILNLKPDVIIGYGIDNKNPTLDNLERSGLKIMLNGDWNEETALGKAEWIKLFGALYGKQKQAEEIFAKIEKDFTKTLEIAKSAKSSPTILAGDMFEDRWYLPKGTSWGSLLMEQANGNYLWKDTKGTGSLSLSFETVFEKAKNAEIWITSGQFSTLKEMTDMNPHYTKFDAFAAKNVYTFSRKKGKKGGILYYELAPNRPDLVLKDLVKVLHPELLNGYQPFFFEKLQ